MARIRALFLFLQVIIFTIWSSAGFTIVKDIEQDFETEIRDKRDVLKGKNSHDLVRSKRYIGRVPVAYMKKVNLQPYGDVEESYATGNIAQQPTSHFREFQPNAHNSGGRHVPRGNSASIGDLDTSNLTDDEIQTLLLMLEGYELNKANRGQASMTPSDQYYGGKDDDRMEFLGDNARSKRTGARHLMVSSRVKKETDPSLLSSLDRVFSDDNTNPSGIIHTKPKVKKDIDWSNYLGIDKRNPKPVKPVSESSKDASLIATPKPKVVGGQSQPNKLVAVPLTSTSPKGDKENKKKEQERKENETVNKDEDRQWVLDEFYKNFAMMTNVKRKRESPSVPSSNSNDAERLEELEKAMTQVGDKIIWDALKYTGSHRDQDMSPQELAKVKASIIDKLSTAYSLEKVRDAVEELRRKIAAFDNRQA